MNNVVWLFSYLTDTVFALLYFRRRTYAPNEQHRWLKPILLLLLLLLYLNDQVLPIPHSFLRFFLRAVIYFAYLFCAEGVPWRGSVYTALFWSVIFTLFQNILFGPFISSIFKGEAQILGSPFWNQFLLSLAMVGVRVLYLGSIALLFPFPGMGGADLPHIGFVTALSFISIYIKQTGTDLSEEFASSSSAFSVYFILLHIALLLLLLTYEYSRRHTQEMAIAQLQNVTAQALLENIQSRQSDEESIRALRHDLKNHLLTLQLLLEDADVDQAKRYIQTFLDQAAPSPGTYRTGNDLLDGLLRQKLSAALARNVEVTVALDFSRGGFIHSFDLCVLMGNILDNAVEACLQVEPSERRFIHIQGSSPANCLLIRVENSCVPRARLLSGLPATTKADKRLHGFGLRNMDRVLQSYGGHMTIDRSQPDRFALSLLIPLPEEPPAP